MKKIRAMFYNYLKVIIRNLLRSPFITSINIFGLMLGLGVSILIVLYIQDEFSYGESFADLDQLYRVEQGWEDEGDESLWAASQCFISNQLSARYPEIETSCKFIRYYTPVEIRVGERYFTEEPMFIADSTFFRLFGLEVLSGNANESLKTPAKAVISESLAMKMFGRTDVAGEEFSYSFGNAMVGAVMKDIAINTHFHTDFIIPMNFLRERGAPVDRVDIDGNFGYYTYIKLKKNADVKSLQKKIRNDVWELTGFTEDNRPDESGRPLLFLRPVKDIHLYSHGEKEIESNSDIKYVRIFSIVALFIILIACINYANLTTARSSVRGKEAGIRRLLGASPSAVMKQFIIESIFLSLIGVLLGVTLAEFLTPVFNRISGKNIRVDIFHNQLLQAYVVIAWFVTGFLSGLYPALLMSGVKVSAVLKMNSKSIKSSRFALYFRRGLVIFQFMISVFLIISTLVIHKQMNYISSKDPGFNKEDILVLKLESNDNRERNMNFRNELFSIPEVSDASLTGSIPGERIPYLTVRIPSLAGVNSDFGEHGDWVMRTMSCDEHIGRTLGLEIVEGRMFSDESGLDADQAFILNETAVREFEMQDPLGKRFEYTYGLDEPKVGRVIGIVKDFHYASLHHEVEPLVMHYFDWFYNKICIRLEKSQEKKAMDKIEKLWEENFPGRNFDYFFLEDYYDNMYVKENAMQSLVAIFAFLAIVIACMGLLGLAAYMAEQRTRETGIRKVLGASKISLIRVMSKEFLALVLVSNILIIFPAYLFVNSWLSGFAFSIGLTPLPFVLSLLLSFGIALITTSLVTLKAAATNPVDAIRCE